MPTANQAFPLDHTYGPSRHARFLMGMIPGVGFGPASFGSFGPAGFGPEVPGGWRGDHSFNHGAVMYALMNFVEPEVAQKHPDWTSQKIHTEARHVMTLRLWENRTFANEERGRKGEMSKRWEITETSPGEFELTATQAGEAVTLRQLWEHTKEYAEKKAIPSAYNPEEERVQLAMQDAFIAGHISSFVSVLSHPDNVRYVQVWQKENDGSIIAKTIDVGVVIGRGMSTEEASDLVEHLATFYSDTGKEIETASAEYPHVMVRQGNVEVEDIKIIARVKENSLPGNRDVQEVHSKVRMNYVDKADKGIDVITAATMTVEQSMRVAAHDVTRSIRELHTYTNTRTKKRIQNKADALVPPFLQFLHPEIFYPATVLKEKQKKVTPSVVMSSEPSVKNGGIPPEEPIPFSAIISILQEDAETQDKVVHRADKAFLITEDNIVLSEQDQEVVFSLFTPVAEIPRALAREAGKQMLLVAIDEEVFAKTKEFVQKIDALPVVEQKQMIGEEKKHILKQILFLWEIVGETARSEGKTKARSIHLEILKLNTFKENNSEHAKVEKFTFALTAWMLLKLTQYYVSLDVLETFVDKKEDVSLLASLRKEKPKGFVQKETGQWILLSIIWYLAQIREQGFAQQKAGSKKKQKKHAPVVIFAYGS